MQIKSLNTIVRNVALQVKMYTSNFSAKAPHVNKSAQGFPDLISQDLFESHIRVIGHPAKAEAEVGKDGTEWLSNEAEPLEWLFHFKDHQLSELLSLLSSSCMSKRFPCRSGIVK
jgi:hypothetical protein